MLLFILASKALHSRQGTLFLCHSYAQKLLSQFSHEAFLQYFDLAISAVIGLNVITMAMEFYMMPMVSQL
jgi:hypothetical protein